MYREEESLHAADCDPRGFEWIDYGDTSNVAFSFIRRDPESGDTILAICNFTPVPRHDYRIGLPSGGVWTEILNSDAGHYGGSGMGNYRSGDRRSCPLSWPTLLCTIHPSTAWLPAPETQGRRITNGRNQICIHGHFYQPSRENPWTGMVMRERSAAPWHDWNERITDECYLPNTAARILDAQGLIRTISNNYSRISSDFGPTLLTWLERARPAVYENILCADTLAQERFSGHGSTLAHPYHHLILPLLSRADKETEVRWGIRDFEDRFGRYPEGMWLPEMAVDLETLGVLADHDIRFTLLSPHQACRTGEFRQESGLPWTAVSIRPSPISAALLTERR